MNPHAQSAALGMLDRFEAETGLLPQGAERLVVSILRACGHEVTQSGFVGSDAGADCYFDTVLDGRKQRIGVEVKSISRPVAVQSVYQAHALADGGNFDRSWVVSRSGFSPEAVRHADALAGVVDLLSPADLRGWIARYAQAAGNETGSAAIIRAAMRQLAKEIALNPLELATTEWRDLERVLREVFEGIGFDTRLTRPGKDGGFDLELVAPTAEGRKTYLVEVKHWTDQKPGSAQLKKFVKVSIEREVDGAIFLSTSGFTRTIYSGLVEVSPPIRLGNGEKVVGLCKTYYRLSTGYWLEESLPDTLFADTILPARPPLVL